MSTKHKRWWNCWLTHHWGNWSGSKKGYLRVRTDDGLGKEEDTTVQSRHCLACNYIQTERA